VIGADGFGLTSDNNTHYKIPHIGSVLIGNNVWIGSNCSIDRGTLRNTVIGSGTKLDNLIQIAHNVKIGKNCLMAAQVAIAGSTTIGDNVTLAGQVGIIGHLTIGRDSVVASKSAVYKSLKAGSFVSGIPARSHKNRLRQDIIVTQLPNILNRLRKLEKELFTNKEMLSDK
jgi:UDP-3-O-[3-hydroxymyristoyl] glucosamine N-acyltransferase